MWGERRPNDVILECFNCMWEVVRLRRWERLEDGKVGNLGKVGG